MAWRRSQKVQCISDIYERMKLPPCVPHTPKLGDVCTIDTIEPYPSELSCGNNIECVQLRFIELPNPVCDCMDAPASFCSCRFKPLVENEQAFDISALVDAAAKVTLPKREDAKAFFQGGVVTLSAWPVVGERPGESLMPLSSLLTPRQLAELQGFAPAATDQRMQAAIDRAADDITRKFVRDYVMPWLVKRLGL